MALGDLTSPDAVISAFDEYDSLGQEAFLAKYGFGRARRYFAVRDGKRYDSKAIVGAAHGYQHGTPLLASEFSGGEETVANKLTALGFAVERTADGGWHYRIGDITTRAEIHGRYGGATYGGIEPSTTTPNIMLYTDPEQGALNGYDYDGVDGNDPNVFYYTGKGRFGHQELRERNASVRDHAEQGRTLRLFEALDEPAQEGGKRQRYLGAFYVDPQAPYRMEPAPDAAGEARDVVVFRLVREGEEPLDVAAAPPRVAFVPTPTTDTPPGPDLGTAELEPDEPEGREWPDAAIELSFVPSEQNTSVEYELQPRTGTIARREEGVLVSQFEAWLRRKDHELQRVRIRIPGERHELITDTWDATENVLYEAKSKSDRATVRLAVGQLLDYLRFIPEANGRILLPEEPSPDIKAFIRSAGLGMAYRRLGSWVLETTESG